MRDVFSFTSFGFLYKYTYTQSAWSLFAITEHCYLYLEELLIC